MEGFNTPSKENKKLTQGEAYAIIQSLAGEMQVMGANCYEPSAVKRVVEALSNGSMSPEESVAAVEDMRQGKQDYH